MSEFLFNRYASLVLNKPGVQGLDISGLRFSFDVTKTLDATANAARIEVYNLSQDTRTFAESDDVEIILAAGYSGLNNQPIAKGIFRGDIVRIQTEKRGGDVITTIETGDAIKAIAQKNVNISLKEGTPVLTLVQQAALQLGVGIGELQGFDGQSFLRGYSGSGKASDQLSLIADRIEADWSIQDGVLQFVKRDSSLSGKILVFSPETGLIGSPNKKIDDQGKTNVQFTSLLQPDIKPGIRARVTSRFVNGDYKVTKVTHRGDTRSGNWYSEVEAE
jgi:hypothetical protein